MRTAIFSAQKLFYSPIADAQYYALDELAQWDSTQWDTVFIIGSNKLDEETIIPPYSLTQLWQFVENGGTVYGELIEAFDFTSSRLWGWKQDFSKTRRTFEKLRVNSDSDGLLRGELLEWSGVMAYGFPVDSDSLLEFGSFRSTHRSEAEVEAGRADFAAGKEASPIYPGLQVRKLGRGQVVYAAFSLLSSNLPETLRPYYRWEKVMRALTAATGIPFLMWPQLIRDAGKISPSQAVTNNMQWFLQSGILPSRDGKAGVYENIHSGTTRISKDLRPDCHAHTALMFFLYGKWSKDSAYMDISHRLLQYLFDEGYQDMEPASPSYGLFKWFNYPGKYPDQMFTDDNAWVCFVLFYLYRQTRKEIYLERALPIAEALLATQNADGVRPEVLRRQQLADLGREGAAKLPGSMNPHFESIAHAAYIQAYIVTKQDAYLQAAMKGSLYLLEHWAELKFMYSRTSGLSRFLLPLGYLSHFDDSGKILGGMARIVDYLLSCQSSLGGIEEMDNPDPDRFGKEDAGVFIHNGEGIADQLYTNNFLLMNVWELWKSKGDERYKKLYVALSEYMCRIQIVSEESRYDGGWMRAYDLRGGEYYGNNGDTGWGPYCMESGWTNAMASSGLLLGLLNESIYD